MSFSSLPTELVRQIIESTVPSTFHSTTYRERQAILRSLCLVTRRFRQIAQPLAFSSIRVESPGQLVKMLDTLESKGWNNVTHELIIRAMEETPELLYSPWLERLAQHAMKLRTLVLNLALKSKPLDFGVLKNITSLRSLRIYGEGFKVSSPFVLRSLVDLELGFQAVTALNAFFDPIFLPVLENLALVDVYTEAEWTQIRSTRLGHLLPRLNSLYVDWELLRVASTSYLRENTHRILFHCYSYDLFNFSQQQQAIEYLRIWNVDDHPADSEHSDLTEFISWIQNQSRVGFRSLYVDEFLRPGPNDSPELSQLSASLLEACKSKQVEVIFEEQSTSEEEHPWISPDFVRKQKQRAM